jgi:hypothetical protein
MKWMCATIAVACLFALLPPRLLAAGSEWARRAHDLQVAVDSRWAGGANGGYYPIRIRLTNLSRPRALEFVFSDTGGSDSRLPTVSRQVTIDQNAMEQFTLPIPLVSRGATGLLRVFENGRELDQLTQHVTLPDAQQGWGDRPALLVVSPTPAAVDCTPFEQAVESLVAAAGGGARGPWGYGSGGLRTNDFQVIPPQMLPESWIDYSTLDVVAVPLAALENKFPGEARSALLKWVMSGGTLIVYEVGRPAAESADLARLLELGSRPPQFQTWRPADPAQHHPITVFSEPAAGAGMGMPMMIPGTGPPAVGVAPLAVDAQGNPINLANKPLWPVTAEAFSRLDYLSGQVFAFPANPFPGAAIDWAWWLNSARYQQNLKFTARNGMSSRQRQPDFFTFLIPGVGAIPVMAFILLITLFAIIIGPVNYFVVWRRRQLYLLVLTIPAIAFLTTASLFGYAVIADGFGVQSRLRSFTLLDQHSRTAVSYNRISLYAGIVPSAGLKFSPETAVFPVWPDHGCLESGSVDFTEMQHLARGWLRSRTPAQFETISVRAERARLDIRPAGAGEIEVANGLEWDIDLLVVKDEAGGVYAAHKLPAGGSLKAATAGAADLQALTKYLANDELKAPPGAGGMEYNPWDRNTRKAMMSGMYYGQQETSITFGSGTLESSLRVLNKPAQEPAAGGLAPRTYLAVIPRNPGIELGIAGTRAKGGLHVVMGYY